MKPPRKPAPSPDQLRAAEAAQAPLGWPKPKPGERGEG
jgi:hypothetical protein